MAIRARTTPGTRPPQVWTTRAAGRSYQKVSSGQSAVAGAFAGGVAFAPPRGRVVRVEVAGLGHAMTSVWPFGIDDPDDLETALALAPVDDEPLTVDDLAAIDQGMADYRRGAFRSLAAVLREIEGEAADPIPAR
jgi:hypothetical protein